MSGEVLYNAPVRHKCEYPEVTPGSVWRCECGRLWHFDWSWKVISERKARRIIARGVATQEDTPT